MGSLLFYYLYFMFWVIDDFRFINFPSCSFFVSVLSVLFFSSVVESLFLFYLAKCCSLCLVLSLTSCVSLFLICSWCVCRLFAPHLIILFINCLRLPLLFVAISSCFPFLLLLSLVPVPAILMDFFPSSVELFPCDPAFESAFGVLIHYPTWHD